MKLGSHFTDEQRARLSLAGEQRRGIPKSDITRAKISAARMGIKFSDETKAKLSAAEMGNKRGLGHHHEVSAETRAKLSAALRGKPGWNKGIPEPEEQKRKQAIMMMGNKYSLGHHPSGETKAKQSKAGWEGGRLVSGGRRWKAQANRWLRRSQLKDMSSCTHHTVSARSQIPVFPSSTSCVSSQTGCIW